MSSYTMQLREYIEQATQDQESLTMKQRIEEGRKKLFDFEYPIFDSAYKATFETHFIRKFYMREIGFETEGLFKFQLETWLIINMPYFNKLFQSELLVYDPLTNAKMNVTHKKTKDVIGTNVATGSSNSTGNLTENHFNRDLQSDTPDSRLNITPNADGSGVISYASKINESKDNGTKVSDSTSSGNSNTTTNLDEVEDYVQSRIGKIGVQSYPKMVEEFRKSFIRIENKMFDEMQELFMLVY